MLRSAWEGTLVPTNGPALLLSYSACVITSFLAFMTIWRSVLTPKHDLSTCLTPESFAALEADFSVPNAIAATITATTFILTTVPALASSYTTTREIFTYAVIFQGSFLVYLFGHLLGFDTVLCDDRNRPQMLLRLLAYTHAIPAQIAMLLQIAPKPPRQKFVDWFLNSCHSTLALACYFAPTPHRHIAFGVAAVLWTRGLIVTWQDLACLAAEFQSRLRVPGILFVLQAYVLFTVGVEVCYVATFFVGFVGQALTPAEEWFSMLVVDIVARVLNPCGLAYLIHYALADVYVGGEETRWRVRGATLVLHLTLFSSSGRPVTCLLRCLQRCSDCRVVEGHEVKVNVRVHSVVLRACWEVRHYL
jgi:hypothetical protein